MDNGTTAFSITFAHWTSAELELFHSPPIPFLLAKYTVPLSNVCVCVCVCVCINICVGGCVYVCALEYLALVLECSLCTGGLTCTFDSIVKMADRCTLV